MNAAKPDLLKCAVCGAELVPVRPDVLCVNDHKHVRCPRCSPEGVGGCLDRDLYPWPREAAK